MNIKHTDKTFGIKQVCQQSNDNYEFLIFMHKHTFMDKYAHIYEIYITRIHPQACQGTFNLLTGADEQEQMFTCVHMMSLSQRWQIYFFLSFSDYRHGPNQMA